MPRRLEAEVPAWLEMSTVVELLLESPAVALPSGQSMSAPGDCTHMHPHAPTCTPCIHCNPCHTRQHKTSEDHPRNVAHHQTAYFFASSTAQALVIQAQRKCSRRSCFAKHVTNRTKCSEAVCGTLVHTWNENIAKKRMPNKI